MGSLSEEIYERLVSVLKDRQIKQNDFYNKIGLSRQTVFRWKTGSMPASDTLFSIAKELNISIEWLISGKGVQNSYEPTSPVQIVNRINNRLEELTQHKQYENFSGFYDLLNDICEPYELGDWFCGRQIPSLEKLCLIADKLKLSVQFLITGSKISAEEYADYYGNKDSVDEDFYRTLHCLNQDNKNLVKHIASLCLHDQSDISIKKIKQAEIDNLLNNTTID